MRDYDRTKVIPSNGEFQTLPAGGYVCRISSAVDVPDKEYVYVEYDIAEGEFKGYHDKGYQRAKFWGGRMYRSYKDAALPMFEAFLQAVEKTNIGYQWDRNPASLIGKGIGIVTRDEEYMGEDKQNGGEKLKVRQSVAYVLPVADIRTGNYTVPEKKLLTQTAPQQAMNAPMGFTPISDDAPLPF